MTIQKLSADGSSGQIVLVNTSPFDSSDTMTML
jgi:hypothetical protein